MNIIQFNTKLSTATSLTQVEKALDAYLSTFGFKHYAVTYYSSQIKWTRKLTYDFVSQGLRLWHQYYLEQGFADVDRTLETNSAGSIPLFWNVHTQLSQAKHARERQIRTESIEFGIDQGLSIPVHGPNNDFLCWTLHQFRGETSLQHYETLQFEWLSAAHIYYHYLHLLLAKQTAATALRLSKREQQCLNLTAKGWRLEQIAKELQITPRTVNFHLQNANKKLGVNNKYLAMIKYKEMG